jgi:hypothetical protein
MTVRGDQRKVLHEGEILKCLVFVLSFSVSNLLISLGK